MCLRFEFINGLFKNDRDLKRNKNSPSYPSLRDFIMVKKSTIYVAFCWRKGPTDNGKGFQFVDDCRLVFDHESTTIGLFEDESYGDGTGSTAALMFNIKSSNIHRIHFRKLLSKQANFEVGQVTITGVFDRGCQEKIILEMDMRNYVELRNFLHP